MKKIDAVRGGRGKRSEKTRGTMKIAVRDDEGRERVKK
jgi:hypothetical protein